MRIKGMNVSVWVSIAVVLVLSAFSFSHTNDNATGKSADATVSSQVFDKTKKNTKWKSAFITGKSAQVVFMNISPATNVSNDIGTETHKFDQIIYIVEGNGKIMLGDKSSPVKSGDMIFIPEGVSHNLTNLNAKKPLKIMSIYSATDIPANAAYAKKSDEPVEK